MRKLWVHVWVWGLAVVKLSMAVPSIIVQYGLPRTATSLQFQTLCLISCLKFGVKTKCVFDDACRGSAYKVNGTVVAPLVCKTHVKTKAVRAAKRGKLFVTSSDASYRGSQCNRTKRKCDDDKPWRVAVKSFGARVEYAQVIEAVSLRGGADLVSDYAKSFRLDTSEIELIRDYIREWEVLRVCCGAQMSSSYRHRLWATARSLSNTAARAWDAASLTSEKPRADAQCDGLDLVKVEKRLVATHLFNTCRLDTIRRLSKRDRYFDGGYCQRASRATAKFKLGFNDPKYKSLAARPGGKS